MAQSPSAYLAPEAPAADVALSILQLCLHQDTALQLWGHCRLGDKPNPATVSSGPLLAMPIAL